MKLRQRRVSYFGGSLLLGASLLWGCIPKVEATGAPEPASASANLPVIENGPWLNADLPPQERVKLLLEEMSEDEKLLLVFGYYGNDAGWKNYQKPAEARYGSAGYIPGIPRLGVPAQWQTDAGIGVATQGSATNKRVRTALPSGLATTATWNPEIAREGGAMIGAEARASGFNVMLAGGVNLLRDPYCGRNFEYGGEDPYLAGVMVGAQIAGIQSNHIVSTIKHFAVNDQETDRDTGNSVVADAALRMSDLLAFQFAFEAGDPGSVMCAYNRVNGSYSCESEYLLTDVLRKDWGFRGYVMSDWGAVHSTVRAANAGLEQESGWPFDDRPFFQAPLKQALSSGKVSAARLDEMVGRILFSLFKHGVFEHPVTEGGAIDVVAHAAVSRADAEEAAVLLKNEANLLPLNPDIKSIAIIGGYADRAVLSGGGSSQVYPAGENAVPGLNPQSWPGPVVYFPSSPKKSIERLAPSAVVTFDPGKKKSAAKLAAESDVAIVFATQWTTESIDTDVSLPDGQDALIAAVIAANPRTIVVLQTGGPVLMPWAADAGAILEAWYPGTSGGEAIANLLFGKVNPSGHLPLTIPQSTKQLAHPSKPRPGDVKYTEGATVGYKWFDAKGHEPLFEFGHGLSYTTFELAELEGALVDGGIEVSFRMTNRGTSKGKEVAQIYVARPGWEAPKRLGGFTKVELAPGESRQLQVRVDPRLFSVWDEKAHGFVVDAGDVEVQLATSSRKVVEKVTVAVEQRAYSASGPQSQALN